MLILTFTLSGVLLRVPYVTQTSPDSLTILQTRPGLSTCRLLQRKPLVTYLINLGHKTSGSAADTIPNRFHLLAKRIASCKLVARMSVISVAPPSVRKRTGMEGYEKMSVVCNFSE